MSENVTDVLVSKTSELASVDKDILNLQRRRNEILEEIAVLAIDAVKFISMTPDKTTFNVGDRVVCLDNRDYMDPDFPLGDLLVGDVGVVISNYEWQEANTVRVFWERISDYWCHEPHQIKHI